MNKVDSMKEQMVYISITAFTTFIVIECIYPSPILLLIPWELKLSMPTRFSGFISVGPIASEHET